MAALGLAPRPHGCMEQEAYEAGHDGHDVPFSTQRKSHLSCGVPDPLKVSQLHTLKMLKCSKLSSEKSTGRVLKLS